MREAIEKYFRGEMTLGEMESWTIARMQQFMDAHDAESMALADIVDAGCIEIGDVVTNSHSSLFRPAETLAAAIDELEARRRGHELREALEMAGMVFPDPNGASTETWHLFSCMAVCDEAETECSPNCRFACAALRAVPTPEPTQ